ncbi:MAG: hypothetical protein LBD37_07345 [Treponema sp.]|jgi:hypothetical protein|nr:hypothetical protein [Treponema sp.]
MNIASYLESLPPNSIAKYTEDYPKECVPFTGYPRQHPAEKNKIVLIYDPLGPCPQVMEFKLEDVLHVEEFPSAVTEAGEGVPLIKLWIRKGARGVLLEPFEVQDPIQFVKKTKDFRGPMLLY